LELAGRLFWKITVGTSATAKNLLEPLEPENMVEGGDSKLAATCTGKCVKDSALNDDDANVGNKKSQKDNRLSGHVACKQTMVVFLNKYSSLRTA
jgi:hypothetical protein